MKSALLSFSLVAVLSFGSVVKSEFIPYGWERGFKMPVQDEMSPDVESLYKTKDVMDTKPYATAKIPSFTYSLPKGKVESEEEQPFAVGPSDPRFYQDVATSDSLEDRYREILQEIVSDLKSDLPTEDTDPKSPPPSSPVVAEVRQVPVTSVYDDSQGTDLYFTAIVAGCSAAAVVTVIAVGIGCYRLQKNNKAAADVDYPAYGVTGPNKDISPTSGDGKLAHSAQMYHYQHQKQQILAMEGMGNKDRRDSLSDVESEEENEEGDYTVYECPGLAPTGEMEVKNPLFQDDQTPASKPAKEQEEELQELPNLILFD